MSIEKNPKAISLILRQKALVENPDPRVPICLVLDASGSMETVIGGDVTPTGRTVNKDGKMYNVVEGDAITRLDELNAGLDQFLRELLEDTNARRSADLCIIGFANEPQVIRDFAPLADADIGTMVTTCGGNTSLGKAVGLALDLLDKRKEEYQNAGVDYYQPWLVVITDGEPTDDTHKKLVEDISSRVKGKKLSIFPIAVGEVEDLSQLALISPARPPIRLKGTKFREMFEWLSKSVARVSTSIPGETVPLDKKGIDAWGEL